MELLCCPEMNKRMSGTMRKMICTNAAMRSPKSTPSPFSLPYPFSYPQLVPVVVDADQDVEAD